jgi:iron complex transport system substrate-binding protein
MRLLRAIVSAAFLTAGVSHGFAAEIQTAKGPVTIDKTPQKLAVFDIAAVDTIDSLGVKIAGLPQNLYVPELARLKEGSEVVGDIFEPNLEALAALTPDLIVLGGRSSPQLEATQRVAPSIDMTMDGDAVLEQAKERLATYGDLLGKQDEARAVAAKFDASIEAARSAVKGKGKTLILMTSGPKVTAYGKGSRFGWVHAALDLPPAVEDVETATHGEAISFEFVRDANPDWLIVLDRAAAIGSGEENAKATLDNELVAQTIAWKKGQVLYVPAPDFYIAAGGIQSTTRVLDAITKAYSGAQ